MIACANSTESDEEEQICQEDNANPIRREDEEIYEQPFVRDNNERKS